MEAYEEKPLPRQAGIEQRLVKARARREGKVSEPTRNDAVQMQQRLLATKKRVESHLKATTDKGEKDVLEELLADVDKRLESLGPMLKKKQA